MLDVSHQLFFLSDNVLHLALTLPSPSLHFFFHYFTVTNLMITSNRPHSPFAADKASSRLNVDGIDLIPIDHLPGDE
jgi:hypothetical protein